MDLHASDVDHLQRTEQPPAGDSSGTLDRALPGHLIDLIRDGIPAKEVNNKAVHKALVSTASSAYQRGIPFEEWACLVLEPDSRLGSQARKRGRNRARTHVELEAFLREAWTTAVEWTDKQEPPAGRREARVEVARIRQYISAHPSPYLTDIDLLVLNHALTEADRRATPTPALPRKATAEALDLTEKTVRVALERLVAQDVLELMSTGRGAGPEATRRRANIYRVPSISDWNAHLKGSKPGAQVEPAPSTSALDPSDVVAMLVLKALRSLDMDELKDLINTLATERLGEPSVPIRDFATKVLMANVSPEFLARTGWIATGLDHTPTS